MIDLGGPEEVISIAPEKRRLSFDTIAQMDQEKREADIDTQALRAGLALDLFYDTHSDIDMDDLRDLPDNSWKDVLGVLHLIGEAAVESSLVLKEPTDEIQYQFFLPDEMADLDEETAFATGRSGSNEFTIIYINYEYFLDLFENFYKPRENVRQRIYDNIAHERAHAYIKRHYPVADKKNVLAGQIAGYGDYSYYDKDRAEQFCNQFGKDYVAYKKEEFRRFRAEMIAQEKNR